MKLPEKIKRITLTGPMSGPANNYEEFLKADRYYLHRGYMVINPFTLNSVLKMEKTESTELSETDKTNEHGYRLFNIAESDALILLPGWDRCAQVLIDVAFCTIHKIPMYEAYTNRDILTEIDLSPSSVEFITRREHSTEELPVEPIVNYN